MERRLVLFFIISSVVLLLYSMLAPRPLPPPHQPQKQVANNEAVKGGGKAAEKHPENKEQPKPAAKQAAKPAEKPQKPAAVLQAQPQPAVPEQWVTLGSADPADPYRMLVTLTNKGAAVERIELNSPRYRDIDHRYGYLGHLVLNPLGPGKGCRVQAVGPGTPADKAGLQRDDVLTSFAGKEVADADSLDAMLANTKPGQTVQIVFTRGQQQMAKSAKLTRIPLEVIKPENDDPLSMLLTLDAFDGLKLSTQWLRDAAIYRLYSELKLGDREIADLDQADVILKQDEGKIRIPAESANEKQWIPIPDEVRKVLAAWIDKRGKKAGPLFCQLPLAAAQERLAAQAVHRIIARVRLGVEVKDQPPPSFELEGVNLRTANWKIVPTADNDVAKFRYLLPEKDLEITKTYRLAKVPAESQKDESYRGYHLEFVIEIRNVAKAPGESHSVSYRLDGPNGLPTEGAWYASRVTRCGGIGLREFIIAMGDQTPVMEDAVTIASGKGLPASPDVPPERMLTFIGVDAQYFSAVLMPQRKNPQEAWFEELMPICVGKVDTKQPKLTNTSCRLVSVLKELKPGATLKHEFVFFAGPKKEAVVEQYGLSSLIYYGWYWFVAQPLTHILHWFYWVVGNYGLAIILLTILVRGCMFPLSLKQAAGAKNADVAAGIEETPGETQGQHRSPRQGPAGALPQAQLQSVVRLPADLHSDAGVHRAVSGADGGDRAPRRPAVYQCDPLVLQSRRPRHAGRLARLGLAAVVQRRREHVRAGALLQSSSAADDRVVHRAAEDVHAARRRRTGGDDAEDDEVHDDLHGRAVLQGRQRVVHLLHRFQSLGPGRTPLPAQDHASRRFGRRQRDQGRGQSPRASRGGQDEKEVGFRFPRSAWEPLFSRSHALRGNAPAVTLRVVRMNVQRPWKMRSHAKCGNEGRQQSTIPNVLPRRYDRRHRLAAGRRRPRHPPHQRTEGGRMRGSAAR